MTGIESDEQFSNVIVNAINRCEVFLFMYSKAHGNINPKKDWTVREITFADKKEKRIVFIDIDGYELPDWFAFRFPDQQVIKANDGLAMDKLISDIRKWLGLPPTISSTDSQDQTTDTKDNQKKEVNHQLVTSESDKPHPQAIDLGLPSGTKWASCNVGATRPEEYGDYYAWGETKDKKEYDEKTYAHCRGYFLKSYRDIGSDIAGTQYDVAHVIWGGSWRMPTKIQILELLDNCTNEWTTLNGVYGIKFTSKVNGNSIFLPAAGYRRGDGLDYVGGYGGYWLSTMDTLNSYNAYSLRFHSGRVVRGYDNYDRCGGRTVRPVSK